MGNGEGKPRAWISFHHASRHCGGQFQTRLAMLIDYPERVFCPGCPADKDRQVEALRKFAAALDIYLEAKSALEKRCGLKVVEIREV